MQCQRGELVPIGKVIADLPGPGLALETPQRAFTQADQVNLLVSAREADADLGFMARHCQRKVARTEFSTDDRELGRPELTPLGECGGAVELEIVS